MASGSTRCYEGEDDLYLPSRSSVTCGVLWNSEHRKEDLEYLAVRHLVTSAVTLKAQSPYLCLGTQILCGLVALKQMIY